ncbi:hypothetical protein BOX15_Mlig006478g1 [Macrostomum lignano]|uniref:Uncharacterized protein n=2 Tax=Macrostomum lignano TaxID=282301 RepID=A0A267F387_9PLAT|nr:hypothetical protein BOX15_Mlig006478g1 [Macrostomum lignano]
MAAAVDRYTYTATGVLGDKRPTMLENEIHQRSQLARAKTHCHHFPPNMTMGISTTRDHTALPKAFSWTDAPVAANAGSSSLLSRPKQQPKDFVSLNRDAARSGYATMRENRDFRAMHDYRKQPERDRRASGTGAATSRPPVDAAHGVGNRPSTPIHELIAYKFQNDWIRDQVSGNQARAAATPMKPLMCQPYETRASMLRSYLLPAEQHASASLWKMPRFERSARSRLDTFRSERQRSLAFELHEAERTDRMGPRGLGLHIPSTK